MTAKQRAHYFRDLWPAACKAQGWAVKDEKQRRAATQEATGQESTTGLDQDGISKLFDHLKWLADPYSLERAMPVANPELGADNHQRRQLVWNVQLAAKRGGLGDGYLASIASGKCKRHHAHTWHDLPIAELRKFLFTVEARADSKAKQPTAATATDENCPF